MSNAQPTATITRAQMAELMALSDLAALATAFETLRGLAEKDDWLLLSPNGQLWRGPNPLRLAAQATWQPPGMPAASPLVETLAPAGIVPPDGC